MAKVAEGIGKFFRELRPVVGQPDQSWSAPGAAGERKPVPLLRTRCMA
jgi:hypothetical protein